MKDRNRRSRENLAVVYARYSSRNQQEQSIEGQLAAAQKYAAEKGYTIIREYCDRAKTGTNDNREEFQRMLSDCAKKKFSVIIVWKVDRFGRNREEITFNKYRAKKHGVRVEYVAENISQGPEGVILESVLEGMAEYYSLQLSQNVRRGLLESAKKHKVIGGWAPLGYRVASDKTYEIDPETAPVVQKIFEMYVSGKTVTEIMDYLNKNGYRTTKGGRFDKNNIPRILKNEKYIGTYIYKDIIRDENAIPAIIDKDVFKEAQLMLKVNHRKPSRKWSKSVYLLSDHLICGKCGSSMHGKGAYGKMGVKYNYYACHKQSQYGKCDMPAIRQDLLEQIVMDKVKEIVMDDRMIDFITDKVWDYYCKDQTSNDELAALKRQLESVQKSMANLMKSIEAGLFNDMIRDRMNELQEEESRLKAAIADHELTAPLKLTKDHILYFIYRFRDTDFDDLGCQKRLITTFVNSIFVYEDKITIAFNYSGDQNRITIEDLKKGMKKASQAEFAYEAINRG